MTQDPHPTEQAPGKPLSARLTASTPEVGTRGGPDPQNGAQAGAERFCDVQGRCPACGGASLFLADGGYITCRRLDCPNPDAASELLEELAHARQHGAFTYCPQLVGHVTVAEFARKINEKRTALGQREEAVRYANQQKQRADQAEAALGRVQAACTQLHAAAVDLGGEPFSSRDRGVVQAVTRVRAALAPPAHNEGPTVREAAEADRRWWGGEKAGEQ